MMTNLQVERWWPAVSAVLVFAIWYWFGKPFPEAEPARDFYATLMGLASITVGFLATAMSVLISSPETALVRQLNGSGYVKDLIRYLKEPFVGGLLLASATLLGFLISHFSLEAQNWHKGAVIFLAAWLLAGLVRIGHIFLLYLDAYAKPKS